MVLSPKFQRREVIVPVDESINWTFKESFPEVGTPEIFAVGLTGVFGVVP